VANYGGVLQFVNIDEVGDVFSEMCVVMDGIVRRVAMIPKVLVMDC
jgi:hypothetical protein